MAKIKWKNDGWNTLQEADPKKHILEINCKTKSGKVIEVRIRHNDGEEKLSKVKLNGTPALPMDIAEFEKYYNKNEFEME